MSDLQLRPLAINRFDCTESHIDKSDVYIEVLHYNPVTNLNIVQGRFVIRKDRALLFAQSLQRLASKDPTE